MWPNKCKLQSREEFRSVQQKPKIIADMQNPKRWSIELQFGRNFWQSKDISGFYSENIFTQISKGLIWIYPHSVQEKVAERRMLRISMRSILL